LRVLVTRDACVEIFYLCSWDSGIIFGTGVLVYR
jgi:hypothetical protein